MQLPEALAWIRETSIWQTLRDRRYLHRQSAFLDFYRTFIRNGDLVFDVGANVGHYTLMFSELGGRVVAIEPQAELVTLLQHRFERHRRVTILQTALGSSASTAVLHKTRDLTEVASLRNDVAQHSRFATEHPFSESEIVPVVTLDSIIAAHGCPAFCKIDVEGFESKVLAGLTQPVPRLSFEFNREFWSEAELCIARLGEIGRYRFNYALGETPHLARAEWINDVNVIADLKANPDPLLWGDIYARLD